MKRIDASRLDPRREALLVPFMLLLFIPVMLIAGIAFVIRKLTSPFIRWDR